MAKITQYPPSQHFSPDEQQLIAWEKTLKQDRKIIARNRNDTFARRYFAVSEYASEVGKTVAAKMLEAGAAWRALKWWKRIRWSLCAAHHWIEMRPEFFTQPSSGYALYQSEYIKQKVLLGKQPVSPCSTRATSEFASPHDYTP